MKRIDKNKVYALIGRVVVYASCWAIGVAGIYYSIANCITVYR